MSRKIRRNTAMRTSTTLTKEKAAQMPPRGPGKLNKTVKETVLAVFNELQKDPQNSLTAWAKAEPTEFYKIAAKLIPTEIKGDVKTKIILEIVRGKANTAQ